MNGNELKFQSPKSLTAIVHVRFHYKEETGKEAAESEISIMSRVLDQASELPLSQQEMLAKFADFLNELKTEKG